MSRKADACCLFRVDAAPAFVLGPTLAIDAGFSLAAVSFGGAFFAAGLSGLAVFFGVFSAAGVPFAAVFFGGAFFAAGVSVVAVSFGGAFVAVAFLEPAAGGFALAFAVVALAEAFFVGRGGNGASSIATDIATWSERREPPGEVAST